jgi:hypothetical protein
VKEVKRRWSFEGRRVSLSFFSLPPTSYDFDADTFPRSLAL